MSREFKVGDRVECVSNAGSYLVQGKEYTVSCVDCEFIGIGTEKVAGWLAERFELLHPDYELGKPVMHTQRPVFEVGDKVMCVWGTKPSRQGKLFTVTTYGAFPLLEASEDVIRVTADDGEEWGGWTKRFVKVGTDQRRTVREAASRVVKSMQECFDNTAVPAIMSTCSFYVEPEKHYSFQPDTKLKLHSYGKSSCYFDGERLESSDTFSNPLATLRDVLPDVYGRKEHEDYMARMEAAASDSKIAAELDMADKLAEVMDTACGPTQDWDAVEERKPMMVRRG